MRHVSPAGSSIGNRSTPSTRIVGEPTNPAQRGVLLGHDLALDDVDAERVELRADGGMRRAPRPPEQLYARHLIEQPTGVVSARATGRSASTSSSASRSHAAFRDGSPWSASGAPR